MEAIGSREAEEGRGPSLDPGGPQLEPVGPKLKG